MSSYCQTVSSSTGKTVSHNLGLQYRYCLQEFHFNILHGNYNHTWGGLMGFTSQRVGADCGKPEKPRAKQ